MTLEQARIFLLQLNTDKQLNEAEHEAIRTVVNYIDNLDDNKKT